MFILQATGPSKAGYSEFKNYFISSATKGMFYKALKLHAFDFYKAENIKKDFAANFEKEQRNLFLHSFSFSFLEREREKEREREREREREERKE